MVIADIFRYLVIVLIFCVKPKWRAKDSRLRVGRFSKHHAASEGGWRWRLLLGSFWLLDLCGGFRFLPAEVMIGVGS
jgi:hypothetical protein